MKNKRKISIKSKIIGTLVICWLLPLIVISVLNIHYIKSDGFENKISKQLEQLKFSDQSSMQRLEWVIEDSRGASYDGTLLEDYDLYQSGKISKRDLMSKSSYYISDKYSMDERIYMGMLWYREDPKKMSCSTYNTGRGATFSTVEKYWKEDHDKIMEISDKINTQIAFFNNKNRLYLIRNIYTSSYENAATLVFLIDKDFCFQNYTAFPEDTSVTLLIDDCEIELMGDPVTKEETGMTKMGGKSGYTWENNILHLYNCTRYENHKFVSLVRFDKSAFLSLFYGYDLFFVVMILCLIMVIMILLILFRKNITKPIHCMMEGAKEVEKGNLGYQVDNDMNSLEFQYLSESFNRMSQKLKYQFDHIYEEEIALRDARISALQSHINPHFMNNTLEIINWEARLSGNEKVSKMIGALSILMDAGIDRKKKKEIPLSEEMVSVNAYLYIISERFGERLTVINELPEEIMQYQVPRLILQPVIENAIEHGVAKNGEGTVILYGYREGKFLYLEIVNDSVLSQKDKDKIKRLLSNDYDRGKESSGSIGIANVNQRLKMIYGEDSGLSIEQIDESHVKAKLTIEIKET